jgi:hypothetical protein
MPKKHKSVVFNEPEIIEGIVERNIEEPISSSGGPSRITVHVNSDGQIDWDKSKSGAADELLAAVTNDPTMLEKIAASPDFQDSEEASTVTPEEAGMVLDALTMVEGILFSSISKKMLGLQVDRKVVSEHFSLTEQDHKRQDPPAAQGLQMLMEAMQLDPRYKWAYILVMAHGAFLARASKDCIMAQYASQGDATPPNPAFTQTEVKNDK